MAPIRLGVIGLSARGWASTDLIPPIFEPQLSDKYLLTALCTSSEESAKAAQAKYTELAKRNVKAYFGKNGPQDIANDPEVDMVVVSVKVPDHYEAIMPAIEAGKDIFVEWAPGRNMEETLRIAEAAKAKGIRVLVGAQGTHGAAISKLKSLLDSGTIGKILSTSVTAFFPPTMPFFSGKVFPSLEYLYDINNGTNVITIPIGHLLVVLDHVLPGRFAEVSATGTCANPNPSFVDENGQPTGKTLQSTIHDQIAINGILKANDVDVLVNVSHFAIIPNVDTPFRWTVHGDKGIIELRSTPDMPSSYTIMGDKDLYLNGQRVEVEPREVDKLTFTGKAWLEFAKGAEGNYVTLEQAVHVYRVVDAALVSIREGRKVYL